MFLSFGVKKLQSSKKKQNCAVMQIWIWGIYGDMQTPQPSFMQFGEMERRRFNRVSGAAMPL